MQKVTISSCRPDDQHFVAQSSVAQLVCRPYDRTSIQEPVYHAPIRDVVELRQLLVETWTCF